MAQITENDYIYPKIDLLRERVQTIVTSSLFDIFERLFLHMILLDVIYIFSSQIKSWSRVEDRQNSNTLEVA